MVNVIAVNGVAHVAECAIILKDKGYEFDMKETQVGGDDAVYNGNAIVTDLLTRTWHIRNFNLPFEKLVDMFKRDISDIPHASSYGFYVECPIGSYVHYATTIDMDRLPVKTEGESFEGAIQNAIDASNLYLGSKGLPFVNKEDVVWTFRTSTSKNQ